MRFTDKPKYYLPGLGHSWLVVAVLICGSLMAGVAISIMAAIVKGGDFASIESFTKNNFSLLYAMQMILPILFIWLMGNSRSKTPFAEFVKIDKPNIGRFNIFTLGVVLIVATLSASLLLDPINELFEIPDIFKEIFRNVSNNPIDSIVSIAILAPICEEFILRGTIERGLLATYRSKKSGPLKAILWSAFLFALIHLNPWQAVAAFAVGCLIGWVYYRTHSIWAAIFIHFVNNFSAIILFLIYPNLDPEATTKQIIEAETGSTTLYWAMVAGGAVLLALCIYLLNKYLPKRPQSFVPQKKELIAEGAE